MQAWKHKKNRSTDLDRRIYGDTCKTLMVLFLCKKNKKKGEHMEEQETAVAIAEIKKEIGSLKHRMDSAEEVVNVVHQLAQEMVGLTKEVGFMNKTLIQLTAKVASLEEKPAKRWDTLVSALLGAAAGAIGAMIFK